MSNITQDLQHSILQALIEVGVPDVAEEKIHLEHPTNVEFGDYSTNVAMVYFASADKNLYKSPRHFAEAIVEKLHKKTASSEEDDQKQTSISVAGPGFINFTFSSAFLIKNMVESGQNAVSKRSVSDQKLKKTIVEYMQPNTNKPLHVGHLRNAILGSSIIRVLSEGGVNVIPATINNDRGLHIIKSMWGYLFFGGTGQNLEEVDPTLVTQNSWNEILQNWMENSQDWKVPADMEELRLQKADHFVGYWYVVGDKFAEDEAVQKMWQEMLIAWEQVDQESHPQVRKLWQTMNDWFYDGYQKSAQRIGFSFDPDHISYESEIYEAGREIILDGVQKGIFQKLENGAVQADLSTFRLPNKILLRKDGTGIYMTFDIELTRQRSTEQADLLVWVVGNDQQLYFQQLFAISELLGYGKKENFLHFSYGMVRLPEGKMSSRKGRVLYADDILDLAVERAKSIMTETGMKQKMTDEEFLSTSEKVGMAAIKWTMLVQDPLSEISFDLQKSVAFQGNSGPYIQYTFARGRSVLRKATEMLLPEKDWREFAYSVELADNLNQEEKMVIRQLLKFEEALKQAVNELAPHHIALYLFDLAQNFNTFYNQHSILNGEKDEEVDEARRNFRLYLTNAVAETIRKGLLLLNIDVVEKM